MAATVAFRAEHLLFAVRSEYGQFWGREWAGLGVGEVERRVRALDMSSTMLPPPRAPKLFPGAMARAAADLAALGWIVPAHDGRPVEYEQVMLGTGQRTLEGDGMILPLSTEVFAPFEDYVPASGAGLRWMARKRRFLESCVAAEAASTNPLVGLLRSPVFWEHGGVDDWVEILKLACVCRATVRLVADHRAWEAVTMTMEREWYVARAVLWMFGEGEREATQAVARYERDTHTAATAVRDGHLSGDDLLVRAEARAVEFVGALRAARERTPSRAAALAHAEWVVRRVGRDGLERVMPCGFSLLDHLRGMNEYFSPAAVYWRVLRWAPGGMTQALFLRARSRNRYTMDAHVRSPEQMADLRRYLTARPAAPVVGRGGPLPGEVDGEEELDGDD
jgi:hypothetical protein